MERIEYSDDEATELGSVSAETKGALMVNQDTDGGNRDLIGFSID